MTNVAYVTNAPVYSGIGQRATALQQRLASYATIKLTNFHLDGERGVLLKDDTLLSSIAVWPGPGAAKSLGWLRLGRYASRAIAAGVFDVVHLTNQSLGFINPAQLSFVITVHDIIELLEPQGPFSAWLARYLYRGIARADHIISVSHFTAQTLTRHLDVDPDRITVIYNGVDAEYHAISNFIDTIGYQQLVREFGFSEKDRVVLYVGSDHPRKNVVTAVRAFAAAQAKLGNLFFIKVGRPGLAAGRSRLLDEIDRLGIRDRVRFLSDVSPERLNELYNLADVLLYPSRFEGFGLPPLQAMAAGTPVITSNATSLPEVVGDNGEYGECAALVCAQDDLQSFQKNLLRALQDTHLANRLRTLGLKRARTFSWDDAASEVERVYERIT